MLDIELNLHTFLKVEIDGKFALIHLKLWRVLAVIVCCVLINKRLRRHKYGMYFFCVCLLLCRKM